MPKPKEPVQRMNGYIPVPVLNTGTDPGEGVEIRADRCERCGGLRAHTFIEAYEGEFSGALVPAWRCVNCGDLEDAQILSNRQRTSCQSLQEV